MEAGDFSRWHHLIFCDELENDDDVVCWVCKEAVLSFPAYKCLECNFFQHISCPRPRPATIYQEVKYHCSNRERHHLIFIEVYLKDNTGNDKAFCAGCGEAVSGPAYKCSIPECTFLLHKSCTELHHVIQHPTHLKHTLFLQLPSGGTHCDVCGERCRESLFYRCVLCNFDIDIKCVSRGRICDDDYHQHAFFPLRRRIQFICEACAEESKGIAYVCTVCRILIHHYCAPYPHTIKIRTHDHSLTQTYSLCQVEERDKVFCKLCYKEVNQEYAAYYCNNKCDYVTHLKCAYENQDYSSTTESVASNSVGYESHLVHLVEGINLGEDEKDALLAKIEHFSHPQHDLILSHDYEELVEDKHCEACMQFIISVPFYRCAQCDFFIHTRCTKPPETIKRGLFH